MIHNQKQKEFSIYPYSVNLIKISVLYVTSIALLNLTGEKFEGILQENGYYNALKVFQLGNLFMGALMCLMVQYIAEFLTNQKFLCVIGVILQIPILLINEATIKDLKQNTFLIYMFGIAVLYGFSYILLTIGSFWYCSMLSRGKHTAGKNFGFMMLIFGLRMPLTQCLSSIGWSSPEFLIFSLVITGIYFTIDSPKQNIIGQQSNIFNDLYNNLPFLFLGFCFAFATKFGILQTKLLDLDIHIIWIFQGIGPFLFGMLYDTGKQTIMLILAQGIFILSVLGTFLGFGFSFERVQVISQLLLAISTYSIGGMTLALLTEKTRRNKSMIPALSAFFFFYMYGLMIWEFTYAGFAGFAWRIETISVVFAIISIYYVLKLDTEFTNFDGDVKMK